MTVFWGTKLALPGPLGTWNYRDVLLSVLDGERWVRFARRLSLGLLAEAQADRAGIEADGAQVRAAAEGYRRLEGLLTVEEMEAWLASQDLPFEEWERYIVRGVLLDQLGPPVLEAAEDLSGSEAFGATFFAEALCSDFLPHARDAFAQMLALAAETGPLSLELGDDASSILARYPWLREVSAERLARVRAVVAAARRRLEAATTDVRVRAAIERRRLDWTRLVCDAFLTSEVQVARELVLCLRHQGHAFLDRADRLPGVDHQLRAFTLEEAPEELRAGLVGVTAGEVAGPFIEGERHTVYWIRERRAPDDDDPEIWARARACVEQSVLKAAHTLGARAEEGAAHG